MTTARIDPDFWSHPKARQCSLKAKALWLCGLLIAVRTKTDEVPEAELAAEDPDVHIYAAELVDAGLWEYNNHGWRIHDFYKWYPAPDYRHQLADAVRKGMGVPPNQWSPDYARSITDAHLTADITPEEVTAITTWLISSWASKPGGPIGAPKFDTILKSRLQYALSVHQPSDKANHFKRLAQTHDRSGNSSHPGSALHHMAPTGD